MALMEWGCNHQAFGRDVQPAITNSPTHLLTTIRQKTTTATTALHTNTKRAQAQTDKQTNTPKETNTPTLHHKQQKHRHVSPAVP